MSSIANKSLSQLQKCTQTKQNKTKQNKTKQNKTKQIIWNLPVFAE
jgi:hypothetical protein